MQSGGSRALTTPLEPGHLRVVRTFIGRSDTSMRGNFQVGTAYRCVASGPRTPPAAAAGAAAPPSRDEPLLLPLPILGPLLGDLFLSSRVTFARFCFIFASLACLSAGLEKRG